MLLDHILGIAVISIAYGMLWYFVLHGRSIVEKIDKNGFKSLREIKRELVTKRKRNG